MPLADRYNAGVLDMSEEAAIAAGDGRIIGLASRNLVAAEAWHHGQCYRDYTRPDKACKYSDLGDEPDSDEPVTII